MCACSGGVPGVCCSGVVRGVCMQYRGERCVHAVDGDGVCVRAVCETFPDLYSV